MEFIESYLSICKRDGVFIFQLMRFFHGCIDFIRVPFVSGSCCINDIESNDIISSPTGLGEKMKSCISVFCSDFCLFRCDRSLVHCVRMHISPPLFWPTAIYGIYIYIYIQLRQFSHSITFNSVHIYFLRIFRMQSNCFQGSFCFFQMFEIENWNCYCSAKAEGKKLRT